MTILIVATLKLNGFLRSTYDHINRCNSKAGWVLEVDL